MSEDLLQLLRRDGVVRSPDAILTPLAGGVSSEICRVEDGGEIFVVKRALARLKVRDEWTADTARNLYEQRYLAYVARLLPQAVPALRPAPAAGGYFAMEYLGPEFRNWKDLLLAGRFHAAHAGAAARILGRIHRASHGDAEAAAQFSSGPCFFQLRIEPYLLTTGRRHPLLQPLFEAEAARLAATRECLVHGDFSPKNILIRDRRLVILDCEVAWYGDPAFDVCFFLNHLFLKSLLHRRAEGPAEMIAAFWQEYTAASGLRLEARVPRLLLMLLLARIDGKSPVEYLDEPRRQFVRAFVYAHLPASAAVGQARPEEVRCGVSPANPAGGWQAEACPTLAALAAAWFRELRAFSSQP